MAQRRRGLRMAQRCKGSNDSEMKVRVVDSSGVKVLVTKPCHWSPTRKREPTPTSCPLISIRALWHSSTHARTHTNKSIYCRK